MSTVTAIYDGGGLASTVAANIRAESARRGWKQADLARALGVATPTVNRKWLGTRDWRLGEVEDVAKVLGVSVQDLLKEYTARDSNPEPADWTEALVIPLFGRAS